MWNCWTTYCHCLNASLVDKNSRSCWFVWNRTWLATKKGPNEGSRRFRSRPLPLAWTPTASHIAQSTAVLFLHRRTCNLRLVSLIFVCSVLIFSTILSTVYWEMLLMFLFCSDIKSRWKTFEIQRLLKTNSVQEGKRHWTFLVFLIFSYSC